MQIVLNCVNISRLVKVNLHKNTISKILPIDSIIKNGEVLNIINFFYNLFNINILCNYN